MKSNNLYFKALTIAFCFLCLYANAQTIQWTKNLGGSNWDGGTSVQQTNDGGYILLGSCSSTNSDFSQNNGGFDYGVIKIDALGNRQWSKNYGGLNDDYGVYINKTSDGGYILLGSSFSSDGDFSQNNGAFDYGVIKIDAFGNKQWSKNYGGLNFDYAHVIQQTSDGGYVILGRSSSSNGDFSQNNGGFDYGIIKIDAVGNKQWSKNLGGLGDDNGYSVQQTSDGGYILLGSTNSTTGDFSQTNGNYDYGVIKLDGSGTKQWSKNYGGSNWDIGKSIQQTADGGYILVGWSNSNNYDFTQNNGGNDYGVIKITSQGYIQWSKNYGGSGADEGSAVRQTSDGGYILIGSTTSYNGDFTKNYGGYDYGVIKIAVNGTIQWAENYGGSGVDEAYSIEQTNDGGYILLGQSESNDVDFTQNNGLFDFGAIKLLDCPKVQTGILSGNSIHCATNNAGTITLSGYSGSIIRWQTSTNNGSSWSDINNKNANYNYVNAINGQLYRVVLASSNTCPEFQSVPIAIQVTPPISPSISPLNTAICQGKTLTLTASHPRTNNFVWNTGATTPTLTINSAGTYSVTVTDINGCTATNATTITSAADITASVNPNNISLCVGKTTDLTATGGVSYVWSNGAITPQVTVSAGSYTVTVTDANGCSAIASATISINQPPVTSINAPVALCGGVNAVLSLNNVFNSYLWNNGSMTSTLSISGTGTYSVTVTNADGCTGMASVTIKEGSELKPTLAPFGKICGNGVVTLSVNGSYDIYKWSTGQNTATINVNTAGTYTVTVTNTATGCTGTVSAEVKQFPAPNVEILGIDKVCRGTNVTLSTKPASFVEYQWSNGSTTSTISVSNPDTYFVTVTDENGCTATNSFTLTNYPATFPVIDGKRIVCNGKATLLTVNGETLTSYVWSNGATTKSINVGVGTYFVTATDALGCTSVASKAIIEDVVYVNILGNASICKDQSTTLSIDNLFAKYIWSNGSTAPSINVSKGYYSVTVTNDNGCTAITDINVKEFEVANISIEGQSHYCDDETNVLTTYPSNFKSYYWSPSGSTEDRIATTGMGTYTVTVTDNNGCSAVASKNIVKNRAIVPIITGATTICAGATTTLDAGSGYSSYLWSNGTTNRTITTDRIGEIGLTVTDNNGCKATAKTVITPSEKLSFSISGKASFCSGSTTTLDAGVGFSSYEWGTGAKTQSITVNSSGTYKVTVSNGSCSGDASIVVKENSIPVFTIIGAPDFCNGGSTVLTTSESFSSYQWSNGSLNNNATISSGGTVTVTVTDINGCSNAQQITVNSNPNPVPKLQGNLSICLGDSSQLTTDQIYSSYIWSNQSKASSIFAKANNVYSVTVTDKNGCIGNTSVSTTMASPLSPTFIPYGKICGNEKITLVINETYDDYKWSSGQKTATIEVNNGGFYTVTVSNNNTGCKGIVSANVQQFALSPLIISGDKQFCRGKSTILSIDTSIFKRYQWSNGSTNSNILVDIPNIYSVTASDTNGCTTVSSKIINENPLPMPIISGSTTICAGNSATLDAGSGYDNYVWSNGSSSRVVQIKDVGLVTVTVTDFNGCQGASSVMITSSENLVVAISGNQDFCAGGSTILDAGIGFSSYLWNTGATTQRITVSKAGVYSVTVSNGTCIGKSSILVNEIPLPTIEIMGNKSFCLGTSTTLHVDSTFASYQWSNGSHSNSINVITPNTYSVTVTATNGCTAVATTVVKALNSTTIFEQKTICKNSNFIWRGKPLNNEGIYNDTIRSQSGCDSILQLKLSIEDPSKLIRADAGKSFSTCAKEVTLKGNSNAGKWVSFGKAILYPTSPTVAEAKHLVEGKNVFVYSLSTPICGVYSQDTIDIEVKKSTKPIANDDKSSLLCADTASVKLLNNDLNFSANNFTLSLLSKPTEGITKLDVHRGVLKYYAGKTQEDKVYFRYLLCDKVCPEICDSANVELNMKHNDGDIIITPNEDGYNDVLYFDDLENYPNNEIFIYNRWGDVVFHQKSYNNDWKGVNRKGNELPQGSYYYVLHLNFIEGLVCVGNILLIR